jgi:hypothetical protein
MLHPGITQLDPMLSQQLLVKVPHIEIKVLFLVKPQRFFHLRQRHPLL